MSETKAGGVLLAVTSCLRASKAPDVKLGRGRGSGGEERQTNKQKGGEKHQNKQTEKRRKAPKQTNKKTNKRENSTWGGEGEEVERTREEEGEEMGRGGEEGGEGFQHFHHRLAPATPAWMYFDANL